MKLNCILLILSTTFLFAAKPAKSSTGSDFDRITKASAEAEKKLQVLKCPSVTYQKESHGPKVKDFFIGMDYKQFKAVAEKLIKSLSKDKIIYDYGLSDESIVYGICSSGDNDSRIVAVIDKQGLVIDLGIGPNISNLAFKASDITLEDFVKLFEQAYGVSLKEDLRSDNYGTITSEGVSIEITRFKSISMKKTAKPADIKKAFD